MPTSPEAINAFLNRDTGQVIDVRGRNPNLLRDSIFAAIGIDYQPKTPWTGSDRDIRQLEALALAFLKQRVLLYYSMRTGKALRHDCLVATPLGWTKISNLRIGDFVLSPKGESIAVTGIFPQGMRKMWCVKFTDGAKVDCDSQHLWSVLDSQDKAKGRKWNVKTLEQITNEGLLVKADNQAYGYRHFIPMVDPVTYLTKSLPLDPYLLGVLLGDGALTQGVPALTTDTEILENLSLPEGTKIRLTSNESPGISNAFIITSTRMSIFCKEEGCNRKAFSRELCYKCWYRAKKAGLLNEPSTNMNKNPVSKALRELNLFNQVSDTKFVPDLYKFGDIKQRFSLLQGLLDTDGYAAGNSIEFYSSSQHLAKDVQELARSLGGLAFLSCTEKPKYTYKGEERIGKPCYTVRIRLPSNLGCPFRLSRKAQKWNPVTRWIPSRSIRSITESPEAEAICISIDSEDGQFVIQDYIVTHNTKVSLDFIQHLKRAKQIERALVIPHAPVGVDEWERQTPIHSDLNLSFVRSGPTSTEKFIESVEKNYDGVVITWSTLQQIFTEKRPSRSGRMKLYANKSTLRAAAECFQALVVDEIHKANDALNLRFDIISELAPVSTEECKWRLGLTGTPFGRDPFGLWAQSRIVDGGEALSKSFFFFREAFEKENKAKTKYGKNPNSKIPKWLLEDHTFDEKKMEILQRKLRPRMLTCKLTDIQDVDVIRNKIELKLLPEQRKMYQEVLDNVIEAQKNDIEYTENAFVRLRQISSGLRVFVDGDGNRRELEIPSVKLTWLEDFLSDLDPALKVVIFNEFIPTGRRIKAMLEKLKIKHEWLWSGTKDRRQAMQNFQEGDTRVFLSNHTAGGTGIDLSAAHYMCIFESPVSNIAREQMEARPLARGGAPLLLDDLVCSPVEEKILKFHKEGKYLSDLFQDPKAFVREMKL